jgi:uncharacterized membrane protein
MPLGLGFFTALAVAGALGLGLLRFDVLSYANLRIGVSIDWMAVVLCGALVGSLINILVARIRSKVREITVPVNVFGVTYRVPLAFEQGRTTIAVNVGELSCPRRSRST